MRKHQIVFLLVYSDKLYVYFHLLSYDYDTRVENADQQKEFVEKLHKFHYIHIRVYPSISLRGNFEALMTRNGVPLEYLMVYEALRLKSFFGVDIAVSRIELAKAGFYATGDGDETRCFSCGVRYKNWRQGERPHNVIHKHNCRHNHGLHRSNEPFAENPLPLITDFTLSRLWYPTSDYDLHDPRPEIHPPYIPHRNGSRSLTSSIHGSTTGSDYHIPDYNQETARLASFRGWPSERGPTPRELAAAGFYYTGSQDKVRCFCCGIGLWKWDEEDDPWREHAHHSPKCRFLAERCTADTTPQVTGSSSNEMQPQRATTIRDKESHDKRESGLCKICLKDPANTVFLPCGHLMACAICASALERCPACRKHIRGTVYIVDT